MLLRDAGAAPLEGETLAVLEQAPCDVALLLDAGGPPRDGPVVVPFGAAEHDWAALELGAWYSRATGAPLRLIEAASDSRREGTRRESVLADASLIVQRTAGVLAEPMLAEPGRQGVTGLARDAGLLVVGFSERWRQEGMGKARAEIAKSPPAPTVLVRRGLRPGGLAAGDSRTRFTGRSPRRRRNEPVRRARRRAGHADSGSRGGVRGSRPVVSDQRRTGNRQERLAEELAGRARERGAAVLVGRCWEAGGAPAFWPWVQALRARARDRQVETLRAELGAGAPYVAKIVPELHDLIPGSPTRRRWKRRARASNSSILLGHFSGERPRLKRSC